jgi:hypothetical protein
MKIMFFFSFISFLSFLFMLKAHTYKTKANDHLHIMLDLCVCVCLVNLIDQVDMDEMKDFFTCLSLLCRLAIGQPSFLLFFSFIHVFIHSFHSFIHSFIRLLDCLMNIWMCYCCVDFKRRGHTNKRDAQEEK